MKRLDVDVTRAQLEKYFFEEALSVQQVAKELGCRVDPVRRRLREYGIKLDPDIWTPWTNQHLRKLLLQNTKLTSRQQSIVLGNVLGDGCLSRNKGARHDRRNACLYHTQCVAHRGYVEWLRQELQPFTPYPLYEGTTLVRQTGKSHRYVSLRTIKHPEFTKLYTIFYPNGKKVVPSSVDSNLGSLALAVWFMDDGHVERSGSCFNTQGFTRVGCELLCKVLWDKFGIRGQVRSDGTKPILRLHAGNGSHQQLHKIIDPLLHSDFKYKCLSSVGVV